MKISHIEHIGIAVKNLDESIKYYENVLGFRCYAVEEVKEQKVKTAFFMVGQTKIELLESTDPEGPIGKFIEKKGRRHTSFGLCRAGSGILISRNGIQRCSAYRQNTPQRS